MNEIKDGWFIQQDRSCPGVRFSLRVREIVEKQGGFTLFRTDACGLVLTDQGMVRYAENDAPFREMTVHCAAFAHEEPRRALILRGEDGSLAEELLRQRSVEQIDIWEENEELTALASRRLPRAGHALSDPRVERCSMPLEHLLKKHAGHCDLIYADFPESVTAVHSYLRLLKQALRPEGILTVSAASLFQAPDRTGKLYAAMKKLFAHTACAQMPSTIRPGGAALICTGSDVFDGARPVRRPMRLLSRRFQAYSTPAHKAVFAATMSLPFFRE